MAWSAALILALLCVLLGAHLRRNVRLLRSCACGYPLDGIESADRCPECGGELEADGRPPRVRLSTAGATVFFAAAVALSPPLGSLYQWGRVETLSRYVWPTRPSGWEELLASDWRGRSTSVQERVHAKIILGASDPNCVMYTRLAEELVGLNPAQLSYRNRQALIGSEASLADSVDRWPNFWTHGAPYDEVLSKAAGESVGTRLQLVVLRSVRERNGAFSDGEASFVAAILRRCADDDLSQGAFAAIVRRCVPERVPPEVRAALGKLLAAHPHLMPTPYPSAFNSRRWRAILREITVENNEEHPVDGGSVGSSAN